jgi:hypothetical protein
VNAIAILALACAVHAGCLYLILAGHRARQWQPIAIALALSIATHATTTHLGLT